MKVQINDITIEGSVEEWVQLIGWSRTQRAWFRCNEAADAFFKELDEVESKLNELCKGEEPAPDPEPEPVPKDDTPDDDTIPVTVTYRRKKPKDMERSKKAKAIKRNEKHRWEKRGVDVKVGDEWYPFDSVSAAAKFIGGSPNNLSTALQAWKDTYRGHEVRYHISDNPDQPELDACLAEIEARNKEPYQPSTKP